MSLFLEHTLRSALKSHDTCSAHLDYAEGLHVIDKCIYLVGITRDLDAHCLRGVIDYLRSEDLRYASDLRSCLGRSPDLDQEKLALDAGLGRDNLDLPDIIQLFELA